MHVLRGGIGETELGRMALPVGSRCPLTGRQRETGATPTYRYPPFFLPNQQSQFSYPPPAELLREGSVTLSMPGDTPITMVLGTRSSPPAAAARTPDGLTVDRRCGEIRWGWF